MKKIVVWGTALLILAVVNFLIIKKEHILSHGKTMLLRLAPVDPRSLIQGDYMLLSYSIARDVPNRLLKEKGYIVVSLDQNDVAKFVRIHRGEKLEEGEHLLFYRKRRGLRLGAESFMFQEGEAQLYSKAQYGELKVAPSGVSVLVGLRGENFERLGKKKE